MILFGFFIWPALRQTAKGSCDLLVCRVRLHLGGYPPWLLTLSRQSICCLNSVQDLQNYDLYQCFSPSSSLKLVSQTGYQLLIFSRAIGHRIKSSSAKSRQVFKLRVYLSTDEVFKSLIAKTGWIFMMILNDWGFHTGLYYSNLE